MTDSVDEGNAGASDANLEFVGAPSVASRLGELGFGVLAILFTLMVLFPPSGLHFYTWLFAPLSGLVGLEFLRRAADPRPRLVVHRDGIMDRTAILGGTLEIPWEEIREISESAWSNNVEIEVADLEVVKERSTWGRRIWLSVKQVFGRPTVSVSPLLLGIKRKDLRDRLEQARFSSELRMVREAQERRAISEGSDG